MGIAIHFFPEATEPARRLADRCGIPACAIALHAFPDGESLVRVQPAGGTALLYRSLDNPNHKLVELLLAASALRDAGAERVILIAPYLGYMRQDMAFHEGEAVSQRVVGELLAAHFDGLVTVDPHLHRTSDLAAVVQGIPALAVSAAPAIIDALRPEFGPDTVLIGPDAESRPWVGSIADPLGLDVLVGRKQRTGDRAVGLVIPGIEAVRDRPVVLIDDCVSSGTTLISCARLLEAAGATSVDAVATHCLASETDIRAILDSGIASLRATDTTRSRLGVIAIAPVLAQALGRTGWLGNPGDRAS